MIKNRLSFLIIFLVILFSLSCKQSESSFIKQNQNNFLGNQTLSKNSYFESITESKGYIRLKDQNTLYENTYTKIKSSDVFQFQTGHIKYKFEKQLLNTKENYRVVLYTLIDNKKKDSIIFYTKENDLKYEFKGYTCMSYLNLKTNKLWQIKYLSYSHNDSVGIVSYEENSVLANGTIQSDSLHFLDESLDVEIEKNNLY
jgi:hypothetical protein